MATKSSPFDKYSRSALEIDGKVGMLALDTSLYNQESVELGASGCGGGEDMLRCGIR